MTGARTPQREPKTVETVEGIEAGPIEPRTVNLNITVEVEAASDEQIAMYREMATLFEDRFHTFVEKNMDYGSSFQTAGQVDQILGGGPFDSAEKANLYKLFTRIQDKDQRFYQLMFGGGEDHVGEAAADTAGDAMVYWAMIAWLLGSNE